MIEDLGKNYKSQEKSCNLEYVSPKSYIKYERISVKFKIMSIRLMLQCISEGALLSANTNPRKKMKTSS